MTREDRFSIEGAIEERFTLDWDAIQFKKTFGGLSGDVDATIDGVETTAVFDGATIGNQDSVEMSFIMQDPDATVVVRYFVE
jgi:hypothetical protein